MPPKKSKTNKKDLAITELTRALETANKKLKKSAEEAKTYKNKFLKSDQEHSEFISKARQVQKNWAKTERSREETIKVLLMLLNRMSKPMIMYPMYWSEKGDLFPWMLPLLGLKKIDVQKSIKLIMENSELKSVDARTADYINKNYPVLVENFMPYVEVNPYLCEMDTSS